MSFYENLKGKARDFGRSIKTTGLAALVAGAAVLGASQAKAATIDVTSFEQLLSISSPPDTQSLVNKGDFTINGATPTKKCSLGFGKTTLMGTAIVGYANTVAGDLNWLSGSYNGDPSTSESLDNILCLVLDENPSANTSGDFGIMGLYDANNNGKFGTYDTETRKFIEESGEFFYNKNNFKINGVPGDIEALTAYTGDGSLLITSQIDMVPEPATVGLIGLGLAGIAASAYNSRRKRNK